MEAPPRTFRHFFGDPNGPICEPPAAPPSFGSDALAFAASVAGASDSYANGLTIDFLGMVGNAADTATLRNFAVLRAP